MPKELVFIDKHYIYMYVYMGSQMFSRNSWTTIISAGTPRLLRINEDGQAFNW